MKVRRLEIEDLIVFEPRVFEDDRGFFLESFRQSVVEQAAGELMFVQDNHSKSIGGTIRGLHYQSTPGQAKLVRCTQGRIWDVAVDIRPNSKTFGQWNAVELSSENHLSLLIPVGFAHGFAVLSDVAEVQYKCSSYYNGETERGICWNDPDLAVAWPIQTPILSARDQNLTSFQEYCDSNA